jgi:RHS repeat-associated protein
MRISQNRAAAISYYGYDAGGSVRQLMDGAGIATGTYVYDAFGNTVTQTGSVVNPYQYRGEHYDPTLQMYYLRARWYRPQLGRFLTEDLDEGDEDDPSSLHAYLYANADPVNGIDPSGFANTMEGSILSRLSLRTVFADFSLSMRGVSLGGVRSGAKLAYETICCIDRAWSVLGSALDFIAFVTSDISIALPTQQALDLIDEVCKIGSNVSAFARRGKGRKGERRWAGKPSGTQNPRKKWKKLPDGRWQGKDQDGKTVIKPRDWDPPVG